MASLITNLWNKKIDILKISVLVLITLFASHEKYKVFDETGGELNTYSSATMDLLEGNNPYEKTVASYEGSEIYKDHGYAYFPTLMYFYAPPLLIHQNFGFPLQRIWKSVVLAFDIGVSILLIKHLYKKDYLATLLAVLVWSYNPYLHINGTYSYTEPFGIFFLLLGLFYLGRNDILTGLFYALSISFKSFGIVLFPIFLLDSKNKLKFLLSGATYALLMSLPFLKSATDIRNYIKGSILVHGNRDPQGRPFLFLIDWYTHLRIFSLSLAKIYVYIATFGGWLVTSFLYLTKKIKDKYVLALISFLIFFTFTPVLNRTYLIWFIPFLILGLDKVFKSKYRVAFFASIVLFYIFYAWYLSLWVRGVRVFGDFITL